MEATIARLILDELAELVLDPSNTFAPVGNEIAAARAVNEWYSANGIESEIVELIEGRANRSPECPAPEAGGRCC